MTNRERFSSVLNIKKEHDRLPVIEWAPWWGLTVDRWKNEGLPQDIDNKKLWNCFGLDQMSELDLYPYKEGYPFGHGVITNMDEYKDVRRYLYPSDIIDRNRESFLALREMQDAGSTVVWLPLYGFFYFPREILGTEGHMYTFYDDPDLMHMINKDLLEFNVFGIEEICKILKLDFVTICEDMSYKSGPIISYNLYEEFLLPYHKELIQVLERKGIITLIDTDGQFEDMIPWLKKAGIQGALPLERQAGVDVLRIRERYPDFILIGGYDKMVMSQGEAAMRNEFERLLPVMKSGGFIPSCDHQTPPGVSLENYRTYIKLLKEYSYKAVK